ncbi:MAG: nucleoside triphosphate pyrophosphohydrolase family protein [Clostridia bacterium]|nr:nucleoside triphosphate pyrophosphohydrolase family protein [Clostridia bacterium]
MTLNQYQQLAQRTSRKDLSPDDHVFNGMLGLAGEAGECCDLVKKCFYQDGREIREALNDELGDVLWYVAEAASGLGLTMEEIAQHNIQKLKERYPDGFDPQKSLHRQEAQPHENAGKVEETQGT